MTVAEYKNNTTYFAHGDHLGSTRLLTGVNQSIQQNLDYLPFGELNSSDSAVSSHKFTSDERDSESGLDHTWFRKYSSTLGRWTTPDPTSLTVASPASPAFPQSWNRYSHVLNNPLVLDDPSGLWCLWDDGTHDDSPENGGDDVATCGGAGGTWVDPIDTTVIVTADPLPPDGELSDG